MEPMILKQDIVEAIKSDAILYGKVAAALNISVLSLHRVLEKNNNLRLTQVGVLNVLREHLKIKKDSELLTEMAAV